MVNQTLLRLLLDARRTGELIERVPPEARPSSLDDAYDTADAIGAAVGQRVAGWKIGASNARGQAALRLDEPFAGRIFAGTVHTSPAALRWPRGIMTIGAEFTLRVARDLDGEPDSYDAAAVADLVDAVYPSFELNWPSYRAPFEEGGLCIIADNGFSAGLVLGELCAEWRALDLGAIAVTFRCGNAVSQGRPADSDFNPFAALAWLARDRTRRGDPLRAGQVVATGDFIGALDAGPGDLVEADFGPLGTISLELIG